MRAAAEEVSATGLVDTKRNPRSAKRRNWPEAFKRQVIAETLEPGSSVSIVARRHDLNTNQLFKWRRELLPKEPPAATERHTMVPVEIVAAPERRPPRRRVERAGFIEIEFGCGARVCIRGEVAPKTLRQVIELLR
jgi:transposase